MLLGICLQTAHDRKCGSELCLAGGHGRDVGGNSSV